MFIAALGTNGGFLPSFRIPEDSGVMGKLRTFGGYILLGENRHPSSFGIGGGCHFLAGRFGGSWFSHHRLPAVLSEFGGHGVLGDRPKLCFLQCQDICFPARNGFSSGSQSGGIVIEDRHLLLDLSVLFDCFQCFAVSCFFLFLGI